MQELALRQTGSPLLLHAGTLERLPLPCPWVFSGVTGPSLCQPARPGGHGPRGTHLGWVQTRHLKEHGVWVEGCHQ